MLINTLESANVPVRHRVRLIDADKTDMCMSLTDKQIQGILKSSLEKYLKKKMTRNFFNISES